MKKLCTLIVLLVAIVTGAKSQSMNETPLTLEAVAAGTINIVNPNLLTIEYNKNGSGWTASVTNPVSISVSAGDKVQLRGDNACYGYGAPGAPTHITATNDVYVYGNIMSLVHKDDYATNNTLTAESAFCELFCADDYGETANTTIKSHPTKELLLPATSVPAMAYMYMFAKCQGLERAPELPAMTLGPACYHRMFGDCTALAAAPKLPATTLADECYFSMFDGCTALTAAPELPATTLAGGCYSEMFAHCTALTKAPVLLAATLANNCYEGMFDGCSKLSYVKCLATDLGTMFGDFYTSTHRWLNGVSPTGTFVKAVGMDGWLTDTANGIPAGWTVKEGTDFDPVKAPLTIEATEDATTVTISNPLALSISYDKYDSAGNLVSSASSSGATITIDGIDAGSTVQLRGNNAAYSNGSISGSTIINFDKDCYVYGNVMSLVSSTAFATATTLTANYTFYDLFDSNTHLKIHATKELLLPATTLTDGCYSNMFYGCKALTKAPALPAKTLTPTCYKSMFSGCSGLTQACELPATTLAENCYENMFRACSALTTAPALPATTLADYCYSYMFYSSGITAAPELPATNLDSYCYNYMFGWCSSLTTAPELPATTLADYCYRAMFLSCKQLVTPSALPSTTLAKGCYLGMYLNTAITTAPVLSAQNVPASAYYQMFQGCTALTSATISAKTVGESACEKMFMGCTALTEAPDLPATTLAAWCYNYMFSGCTALTKAPALPATTLAEQCYQRMFEECHSLVTAPELPATNLADLCYNDMFWNCTSLKNAPVLPATKLVPYCYTMMFFGCSSLEKAPDLIAPTLEGNCYEHMFMNCTSLNYVKCLATDLGDETATDGWMTNVSATGTFVKAPGVDWSGKGTTEGTDFDDPSKPCTFVHGIPAGWTVETSPIIFAHLNSDGDGNYWATFYNESAGFTADATTSVYTAKVSSDKSKVELTAVEDKTIPAGNAVVLKSSAEAATLTYAAAATGTLADNELMASSTDITAHTNTYMLVKGASGVGFYHWTGTDIPANRGYLIIDGAGAREFFSIGEEVITGIKEIQDVRSKTDDVYYDLNGRRVLYPTKGIYVRNGKKIIFK